MRSKRSHKEIKIDSQDHYGGLAENTPDRKAIKKFKRPPAYQAGKLLVEQMHAVETDTDYFRLLNEALADETGVDILHNVTR